MDIIGHEATVEVLLSTKLNLLEKMLRIRLFDDKQYSLYEAKKLDSYTTCFRHEPIAAGVCATLRNDDLITSTHRGAPHCIAKGIDLRRIVAELFGKKTGLCKGKGGKYHLTDIKSGLLGEFPVVGSNIPIAVGAGITIKRRATGQVVVCFFGDGASNTSTFHEGLNFASVIKVPVLFVCENNGWTDTIAETMNIKDVSQRAIAYGIQGVTVDGTDPEAVYKAAHYYTRQIREQKVPVLIEAKNPMPHGGGHRNLKAEKEMMEFKKAHDPVTSYTRKLIDENIVTENDVSRTREKIQAEIDDAFAFALDSPDPEPEDAFADLYS